MFLVIYTGTMSDVSVRPRDDVQQGGTPRITFLESIYSTTYSINLRLVLLYHTVLSIRSIQVEIKRGFLCVCTDSRPIKTAAV